MFMLLADSQFQVTSEIKEIKMSKSKNESKASQSEIKPQKLNNNPDVRQLTNEELDSVFGGFGFYRRWP